MTREFGYLPHGLYNALFHICEENESGIREVMITLVREMLKERFGFVCKHQRVRESEKTREPYCFNCWRRLQEVDTRNKRVKKVKGKYEITGVVYKEIPTFLDREGKPLERVELTSEEIRGQVTRMDTLYRYRYRYNVE